MKSGLERTGQALFLPARGRDGEASSLDEPRRGLPGRDRTLGTSFRVEAEQLGIHRTRWATEVSL